MHFGHDQSIVRLGDARFSRETNETPWGLFLLSTCYLDSIDEREELKARKAGVKLGYSKPIVYYSNQTGEAKAQETEWKRLLNYTRKIYFERIYIYIDLHKICMTGFFATINVSYLCDYY